MSYPIIGVAYAAVGLATAMMLRRSLGFLFHALAAQMAPTEQWKVSYALWFNIFLCSLMWPLTVVFWVTIKTTAAPLDTQPPDEAAAESGEVSAYADVGAYADFRALPGGPCLVCDDPAEPPVFMDTGAVDDESVHVLCQGCYSAILRGAMMAHVDRLRDDAQRALTAAEGARLRGATAEEMTNHHFEVARTQSILAAALPPGADRARARIAALDACRASGDAEVERRYRELFERSDRVA